MLVGKEDRFATVKNAKRMKNEIGRTDKGSIKLLKVNSCNHYTFNFGNLSYMNPVIDFANPTAPSPKPN